MPADATGLPHGYRFSPRRDPHAPLLALLHADGMDERSTVPVGRATWPGAPLLRPRGTVPHGTGWRFLRCGPAEPADLHDETAGIDGIAACIGHAVRNRDAELVEVILVGLGGGADAAVGLLCRNPRHVAAAILLQPQRRWTVPPDTGPSIARLEVLVVAADVGFAAADAAANLLAGLGAHVTLQAGQPGPTSTQLARTWLRQRLQGCEE